jgi:hypothetical protein
MFYRKHVTVTDPKVIIEIDSEPFMLRQRTDEEVADYDKAFECGKSDGQNDEAKSEAWQRGSAVANRQSTNRICTSRVPSDANNRRAIPECRISGACNPGWACRGEGNVSSSPVEETPRSSAS